MTVQVTTTPTITILIFCMFLTSLQTALDSNGKSVYTMTSQSQYIVSHLMNKLDPFYGVPE